ncbi:MAG: hypothetical protein ISR77_15855 [Pirellulaceae bacterium]|nr:hypothetical protein [Pirellulaceae bacterium]
MAKRTVESCDVWLDAHRWIRDNYLRPGESGYIEWPSRTTGDIRASVDFALEGDFEEGSVLLTLRYWVGEQNVREAIWIEGTTIRLGDRRWWRW